MNKFSWYNAETVEDALQQVNATVSDVLSDRANGESAVFKAGGIDVLDLMKEGLAKPAKIINIRDIKGLDTISYDNKTGLRLGANVTLAQMEHDKTIQDKYFALHQSVAHAGTPQLRNMASLGGNLAQRTRCWYFRSIDHKCLRKGGSICFAREGQNEIHAIMNNGACTSVHSSSISTALIAFDAQVEIMNSEGEKRSVLIDDFFVHPGYDASRENILEANEIITSVIIPPVSDSVKSYYIKQGARESHDWALADVAVVMEMSGNSCKKGVVALGAASPVPVRSQDASAAITGKRINEETAIAAAEASMKNATPLDKNAYKVPLFKAIVKRAILKLA